MSRQPGMNWNDIGKMPVTDFFHVLKLSEGKDEQGAEKAGRRG